MKSNLIAAAVLPFLLSTAHVRSAAPDATALAVFEQTVSPILRSRCYDCHGDGAKKGGLDFDHVTAKDQLLRQPEVWLKVLRNTRSQIMPPPGEPAITPEEQRTLERWIVTGGFGLDPAKPDPGRVTVRRLNRAEYRNTIRDLLGIVFEAEAMLPPDDVGYGFDNIGDVLSLSPIRMEKFIEAAVAAVDRAMPLDAVAMTTRFTDGSKFLSADGSLSAEKMSYYRPQVSSHRYEIKKAGTYRLVLHTKVDGEATPVDPQHARVVWKIDDKVLLEKEYEWADADYLDDEFKVHLEPGEHTLTVTINPAFPDLKPLRTKMEYRLLWVDFDGPIEKELWDPHPNYARFYPRARPPQDPAGRRDYAREVLGRFVTKAYRRPVAPETVEQLVAIAEKSYGMPGTSFEKGIAQAAVAVLASPRFLFHLESAVPPATGAKTALLDESTLASRLSYALWSSQPDDELRLLAARGQLRANFRSQVQRLLADPKSLAFSENFSGQWLQTRGVLDIAINSEVVMAGEAPPATTPAAPPTPPTEGAVLAGAPPGFAGRPAGGPNPNATPGAPGNIPPRQFGGFGFGRRPRPPPGTVLTPDIRLAMKQEADAYFHHIVTADRSVLELLQSDYTFVNEALAPVYGLADIKGPEMRRVELPADSARGGVLTMGGVLTVTSNPTRTSPVKRGKWILENILGAPPSPPPPDVPALEDATPKEGEKRLTQRELLALHRADPKCASCHERMDPLGLALEGFNAFGRARTLDAGLAIDASGELATGEKFSGVLDVKRALRERHRIEFYRTLTEKILTYVLGRGIEYYDVPTVDAIVDGLEKDNGRFSTLLLGVLESAPFQMRRVAGNPASNAGKAATLTLNSSAP